MLNKILFPCLAGIVIFSLLSSCKKKAFHHVEIKGRVLNYFTHEPIAAAGEIANDSHFVGNGDGVLIASFQCDNDGYFTAKGKASKGNAYFLFLADGQSRRIEVNEDEITDIGNFYIGSHEFHCKLTLVPDSGKCITINIPTFTGYNIVNTSSLTFPAGTSTTITFNNTKFWPSKDYALLDSIWLSYSKKECNSNEQPKYYFVESPFQNLDTLRFTLHY
jgi:hypothetical protein